MEEPGYGRRVKRGRDRGGWREGVQRGQHREQAPRERVRGPVEEGVRRTGPKSRNKDPRSPARQNDGPRPWRNTTVQITGTETAGEIFRSQIEERDLDDA